MNIFKNSVKSATLEARFSYFVLLLLFLFHFVSNIVIIARDTTPFIADASEFYIQSFYYWRGVVDFIKSGDFQMLGLIFKDKPLQAQLLSFISIPFYSILGFSHDTAIIAGQLFFLVLLLSIFKIGRFLFNNTVGLLAAFIISFYPSVFGFSRVYMLTLPILAISALCVYLFIKTGVFKNRKYSVYFGLACGLGGLLRPRFFIYILIPVVLYAGGYIVTLFRKRDDLKRLLTKQKFFNIFLSIFCSGFLLFPWYSLSSISEYFRYQDTWSTMPNFSNIGPTLLYYIQVLFGLQLHWFFSFLFLSGLLVSFFNRGRKLSIFFLLAWFIFTLILVSSFGLKDYSRLIVPLCVPLALISSSGVESFARQKAGKFILSALGFFVVAQYFFISYSQMAGKIIYKSIPVINREHGRRYFYDISLSYGLLQANGYDWNIDKMMPLFKTRRNFDGKFRWSLVNNNLSYLTVSGIPHNIDNLIKILYIDCRGSPIVTEIEQRAVTGNLPVSVVGLYSSDFEYRDLFTDYDFRNIVLGADYVIIFEGGDPGAGMLSEIKDMFDANISKFEELKTIKTPWGESLIYGAGARK
ncbi:ArnT family glycosyltransferase [Candidatus Omnitrophota bacterium]